MTALDKHFVLRNLNYTCLNGLLQKGKYIGFYERKLAGCTDASDEDDDLMYIKY